VSTTSTSLPDVSPTPALVTVAGPGGAGKTRLALHLAHHMLASSAPADGVMLVELAPLTDSRHVAQALADGLGLPEPSGQALTDVLARACGRSACC
jgi:predicted ATPase